MKLELTHPTHGELTRFALSGCQHDTRVDADAVREHLESGCKPCLATLVRLGTQAHESPFPRETAARRPEWILPRRIEISASGFRGVAHAEQQLFCDLGPYELDLVVREEDGALEISGRVTRNGPGAGPVPDISLELVNAETMTVRDAVASNVFGEFDLFTSGAMSCGIRIAHGDELDYVLVWEP